MELQPGVFDVWAFRRNGGRVEYLLLHTSQLKADRYFNGGRFWQIPSDKNDDQKIEIAIERKVCEFGLTPIGIWAAEHVYAIYNRRFACIQIISVFAAEVEGDAVTLDPVEHSSYRWCSYEEALSLVYYRGLKDGLRSTQEYVTGVLEPARELRLR